MYDVICRKRDGEALSREEITYFIEGYTRGEIPDYQASALLMAIFLQKMNKEETFALTEAMWHSGDTIDLSGIPGKKVDKHSTGGVGDKTTLIVGPIAAACGIPVAKMSGRGLGFTGGTIDKLEAIPGFQTSMEPEAFMDQVREIGIAIAGQTAHLAAADKKLYALRDVTATVDNISLITSSIMSKKLAAGSDAIILDVKCGEGGFMQNLADAEELGRAMVQIGTKAGKTTVAVITDMSQPLGFAVGNSLEVIEAIETLKGNGPQDMEELSLALAAQMVFAGGKAASVEDGLARAREALTSGKALEKLRQLIGCQGGNPDVTEDYSLFAQPGRQVDIIADTDGYVTAIQARTIGLASQNAGAGRAQKEDPIDLSAGICLKKKVGDPVRAGDCLASVYGADGEKVRSAAKRARTAFTVSPECGERQALVKRILS